MRGPPQAPIIVLPNRVAAVEAERFADQVYIRFVIPTANSDRSEPADLERIDVYALTTNPDDDPLTPVPLEDWIEAATWVATVPVLERALPDAVGAAGEGEEPRAPDGSRDADNEGPRRLAPHVQGQTVTFIEELTAESFVAFVFEEEEERDEEDVEEAEPAGPLVSPPLLAVARRTYLVQGVSSRGRESAESERVAVSLAMPAPRPDPPTVRYDESGISVDWTHVPGARLPIQASTTDLVLPSFPIMPVPEPTTYLVYTVAARLSESVTLPVALNPRPTTTVELAETGGTESEVSGAGANGASRDGNGAGQSSPVASGTGATRVRGPIRTSIPRTTTVVATSHTQRGVPYGVERCYVVRTRTMVGELPVIGQASPPTCIVPVDSFPPEPPGGLIAVAGEAAISLVWDPGSDEDLAGYLVLRRTTSDDTLQLLTDEPIDRTAYRDDSVVPNERYVYAVQAVDDAVPANVSPASSEVTERAR
jgi:hypothetical protein